MKAPLAFLALAALFLIVKDELSLVSDSGIFNRDDLHHSSLLLVPTANIPWA